MILHHTKQWGIDLHSVFYRIEIFQISICKNQSVSERLFIQMSMATDRPAILAFASRSLRPKLSATKDDVKVAEIIETGKKICTFATNSNDYDTNYRHSFQLSHLRESGLPEGFPLFASNSVCSPTQTRAQSTTNQPGLLRTGRLLPVLSELRTCALCLWLCSLPRRDAPQTV